MRIDTRLRFIEKKADRVNECNRDVTTASFAFAATQSTIVVICAPKEQPCELPFF